MTARLSPLWTGAEIAAATGGTLATDFACQSVTFDSREVGAGALFVALKGETTDGHRFAAQAHAAGASGLLVSQPVDSPHVLVPDTMAALEALGCAARARANAVRIGVTGSVGKTGVRQALASALARSAGDNAVHASVKSYNNHTGVPLSLARMPADSRFGVFEMGMNHGGELTALSALVRPHIAIITWVASAHRAFFSSEADIASAKGEIFSGLMPGGTAIIPRDNIHATRLLDASRNAARVITFGLEPGADVFAEKFVLHADHSSVTARIGSERLHFTIGMAGRHWVSNALAVLAAAWAAGSDLAAAGLALADLADLPGRGARCTVTVAGGDAVMIDESYNANPASMMAALAVLGAVAPTGSGRRLAILGEMKELGALGDQFHADLAPHVTAAGVQALIVVGAAMKPLADALASSLDVRLVADATAAQTEIERLLRAGDVLLVKGSNSVRLGAVVAVLKNRRASPQETMK